MPTATSPSVDSSISARTLADNDAQMPRGKTREYCICPQFLPLLLSGSTSFTAQDAEAAVTVHAADHISALTVTITANEEQPAVMTDRLRSWWSWRLRALLRLIIVRACAAAAEIRDGDGSCDLRVLNLELLRIFGITRGGKNYASMRTDVIRVAWLLSAATFHYRMHGPRGDKELAFRVLDGFDKLDSKAEHSGLVLHVSKQLRGVLGGLGLLASRRRRGKKTVARQICGHFIDLRCFALGGRRGRNSCFNISLEIAMHLVYLRNIRRGPRGREGKISLASLLEASPDLRELHDMYVTSPRKQRSPKRFNAHIDQAAAELVKSQIFDRAVYRDEILYFKFCR